VRGAVMPADWTKIMNYLSPIFLVTLCFLTSACAAVQPSAKAIAEQDPKVTGIREEQPRKSAGNTAPVEAIRFVRGFITYVFRKTPDISADKPAQRRLLSQNLQKGLAHRQELYREYIKKISRQSGPTTWKWRFCGSVGSADQLFDTGISSLSGSGCC
jgi:hypothetical protein